MELNERLMGNPHSIEWSLRYDFLVNLSTMNQVYELTLRQL